MKLGYKTTQIRICLSNFLRKIGNFFEAVSYHTKRSIHLVRNHERTQKAKYHIKRASKGIVHGSVGNIRNWSDRIKSSESFRIQDDDV